MLLRPRRLAIGEPWAGYDLARWQPAWLAGLAALLGLPAGAIAATRGFDGLYGQDAYAYFDYATTSVRASLSHLQPLAPFFWPPGYPLLVALVSFATGPVALSGQLVSLVTGALVPVLTARLVRELWPGDDLLAVMAGAMVALCGQLWQSSVVVMADTTGLALATLGAVGLVRYARTGRLRWLVLCSAALAAATLARWIYGLVAIPFGLYALGRLRHEKKRMALAHAAAALAVAAALLMPIFGPGLVSLLVHPAESASFAGNLQVYSWSPLNAFRRDFFTADGHLSYALPNGLYYGIAPANLAFFGPFLAPWVAPGGWALLRSPRSSGRLIVGWAAVVYVFHAGAPWQNFRFTLAYLPPLAVLAAFGLTWTARHLNGRGKTTVALCAAVGLLVAGVGAVRLVEGFVDRKDVDLALVRWVQAQSPANARVFSFGPTLTLRHYTSLPTFDLFDVSPADVRAILASPAPTYLLVDESSVEGQWRDQPPGTNFHLLRDSVGLQRVGDDNGYTLYRVQAQ